MSALKCIIFDLDGTLSQTNQLIFDSFNYIAEKYSGKRFSEREITGMFGPPEEGALLSIVPAEKIEEVMKDYLSFYRANHRGLARLYPGIEEILRFVKQSKRLIALFTGKGIHTTMISLEEFGIKHYFDFVVTGNDVRLHKPSSEGIRIIMERFDLQANEVLMVGDSISDVRASHEAGVKVAAVLWDSYAKDKVLQMKTDYVFHNVAEFYDWLRKQFD